MKKQLLWYSPIIAMLLVSFTTVSFTSHINAESKSTEVEYEFYTTPQSVEYGEGALTLNKDIQVVYDDTIDDATRKKVTEIFATNNLPIPEITEEPSKDAITLFVGTVESGGPAAKNAENTLDSNNMDFDQIDAYQLEISNNTMTVIGKDTDAAFYGIVSLEKILSQRSDNQIKHLEINDYANTKVRGFIEGYYGIPWSNDDRKSLMEFGGQLKANSYVFAPKDDPYHREQWEELYPEDMLEEIRELAEVGRDSKTQFVWTISPLGEVAEIAREEGEEAAMALLDENTEKMLTKFDQLYDVGVRQFGVLGDDVGSLPLDYVAELMNSVSEWAQEKGDVRDTLYTPAAYNSAWAWDGGEELNRLEEAFDENIHILWTGENTVAPVEQYTIDRFKHRDNNGVVRRDPLFWLNWPVNDIDMTRVFLGKGDMLEPGVENLAGVVTNPMQEAEASKVAIFAVADYTWNTESFDAQTSWEDSMKYIEPDATEAFHTLTKHMTHAEPQNGLEADESENIKELLEETLSRIDNDEPLGNVAPELIDELSLIAEAGDEFLRESKNEALKEELEPFVHALQDMVLADIEYIQFHQDLENDDIESAKEHYVSGTILREQSLNHERPMVDEEDTVYAIPAGKRLQPFTNDIEDHVIQKAEELIDVGVMKAFVDQYVEAGKIEQGENVRLLQTHLTSIEHFVKQESYNKAVKHMESFKQLIDTFQEEGKIDQQEAAQLTEVADVLIEEWTN
ncbi:beta-N-acetylglucosaminidase domain-containing protein [Oceanobacillus kimchii]|uniref:beta-N-acetylglucosaminidase domain-containing protein n=1 Tax=Oceanobacillus kimchii TaxID=746691 RepID=UPI0021A43016|nr:beta-N-acetylglucosaminidase domain-containing protein [Oceanobacillus kimchii]MCT1577004.1 beta-N-acetylglucosaminidase domain-containing protein [Oceanobacillus kimchii]MCT2135074.1 beta-N-acetylglucosaminidase domain-containing protein [Oceanobacillus kimchii]